MSAINITKMSKPVRGGVGYMATCSECGRSKRLNQVHAKYYVSPESVGWVWALICKCGHTCVVDVSAQHHAHLTPETQPTSQAVVNASALEQSDGLRRPLRRR